MIKITYLPVFVTRMFHGMPGVWKAQHRLMMSWLMVMQALFPGRKTVAELARWTPIDLTEWRFRRLLKADYWDVHGLVDWWAHQAMAVLPPPEDGVLTLTGETNASSKDAFWRPDPERFVLYSHPLLENSEMLRVRHTPISTPGTALCSAGSDALEYHHPTLLDNTVLETPLPK